ncbi:ABC transporter substrate-binding protein [Rhodoplanes azumiensis]|uniref:ABC transporter substrate-binding protein n=1 Tax=Rhodoplanes azumiensis TaxID=1897628 RepID=A0ABW5AFM7_9BRAD
MTTRRIVLGLAAATLLATPLLTGVAAAQAQGGTAICYNCPPQWADWAAMLKAVRDDLGITMPHDNKNSGQALSQILAERASPVADMAYYGITFGIKAKAEGVTEAYKPALFDAIPDGLKDKDGHWWTVHQGTLGLFVNVDALRGKPVPACWADLKKPDYKGLVGYLNPTSAAVGYVGAVAVNLALGGTLENIEPGLAFFKELAKNDPIVPQQTSYARVVSGEIPILLDYDFNAYRAKYTEKGKFAFVIPCEGSVSFPYVMTLVKGAPHPEQAKRVLDYLLSDKGQLVWTNAYLRPARPIEMPAEVAAKFLPKADYDRVKDIDWGAAEKIQKTFSDRYLAEVR